MSNNYWQWTPEQGIPMANVINRATMEASMSKLWSEFLNGYFNGGTHYGLEYPNASILSQQAVVPKGASIQVVTNVPGKVHKFWNGGDIKDQITSQPFGMIVRATIPEGQAATAGMNSEALSRKCSDLLYNLLNDPRLTHPLARSGISHVEPGAPFILGSDLYSTRRMNVTARVLAPKAGALPGFSLIDGDYTEVEVQNGVRTAIISRTSLGQLPSPSQPIQSTASKSSGRTLKASRKLTG